MFLVWCYLPSRFFTLLLPSTLSTTAGPLTQVKRAESELELPCDAQVDAYITALAADAASKGTSTYVESLLYLYGLSTCADTVVGEKIGCNVDRRCVVLMSLGPNVAWPMI